MKALNLIVLTSSLALSATAFAGTDLKTAEQKASYTLGVDLAKNFTRQGVAVDADALAQGMNDVLKNKKLQLTDAEMKQAIEDVKKSVMQKKLAAKKVQAEKNAKTGEAFLSANKNKKGVKVLPSGLQYQILKEGKGPAATENDYLTAHYRGTLIDGTEFDSSFKRGTPIEFQMSSVIKGWGEALKKMKVGSKWKLFIPPALAYGSRGAGQVIGPNETLIFEIELLAIHKDKPEH